jgi:hypothetical protein
METPKRKNGPDGRAALFRFWPVRAVGSKGGWRPADEAPRFCDERATGVSAAPSACYQGGLGFGESSMRRAFLALASVCALAACNPAGQTDTAADAGGGLFPDLNRIAYRAEATLSNQDGEAQPIIMVRDGRKTRVEFGTGDGASTIITNGDTGESFVVTTQAGRTMAIRASGMGDQFSNPADAWQGELAQEATKTGTCSAAGETGDEWTKTTETEGTDTVCVTSDGIILRATDDGRVVWETTSVQRGAQAANLFTLPEGVQVMDLGNMGNAMSQALEAAKQRDN